MGRKRNVGKASYLNASQVEDTADTDDLQPPVAEGRDGKVLQKTEQMLRRRNEDTHKLHTHTYRKREREMGEKETETCFRLGGPQRSVPPMSVQRV
jgi:hypothetical protein